MIWHTVLFEFKLAPWILHFVVKNDIILPYLNYAFAAAENEVYKSPSIAILHS